MCVLLEICRTSAKVAQSSSIVFRFGSLEYPVTSIKPHEPSPAAACIASWHLLTGRVTIRYNVNVAIGVASQHQMLSKC
jgi:hypothetical protein